MCLNMTKALVMTWEAGNQNGCHQHQSPVVLDPSGTKTGF